MTTWLRSARGRLRQCGVVVLETLGRGIRFLDRVRRHDSCAPTSILLCRTDHIGDVLLTLPALAALRGLFPNARITLLVASWAEPVVRHVGLCDEIVLCDPPWWSRLRALRFGGSSSALAWAALISTVLSLRKRRFDLMIEARGDVRQLFFFGALIGARKIVARDRHGGARLADCAPMINDSLHEVDQNLAVVKVLGPVPIAEWHDFSLFGPEDIRAVDELLEGPERSRPLVVIHPSAKHVNKWPARAWVQFMTDVSRRTAVEFVVTGAGSESELCDALVRSAQPSTNAAGKLSLTGTAALFARASLVVMADTGPMHFLHFIDTQALLLFGPTPVQRFAPRGEHITTLSAGFCCQAALHETCTSSAALEPSACMASIAVTKVVDEAIRLLSRRASCREPSRQQR